VKPLRRECRMFRPACTDLWALSFSAHRPCGCGQRPAFPAPSISEGHRIAKLGRESRRGNAESCFQLSSRASEQSERDPGPITTEYCCAKIGTDSLAQRLWPVVMGSRFRGDDGGA